ncbi:MAG: sigma-70 family RNA polymerase sigma factor [Elusimicrobia bacterium]|nr:sigma-70 family RNA polymerase sigma factor [Elusimicrobiota bacterium]
MAPATQEAMTDDATEGFSEFYEAWFDRVYNYAYHRTGSSVRADEVASDTFARVFSSWASFDPNKGDRRTWLFSIAFRAIADHFRSEKRRLWLSLGLLRRPAESDPGPAADLEAEQEHRELLAALAALSTQHREVVSLKFFGGMTNRAIAELTGLSEANVGIILFRSVRRMRGQFTAGEKHNG